MPAKLDPTTPPWAHAWGSDDVPAGFADRVLAAADQAHGSPPQDPPTRDVRPGAPIHWPRRAMIAGLGLVAVASAATGGVLLATGPQPDAPAPPAAVAPPSPPDPTPSEPLPPDLGTAIDAHVADYGHRYGPAFAFNGVVAVGRPGQPTLTRAYGWADREAQAPTRPDTRFRLGVAGQPLLASAVMVLRDRGALKLSDPLRTHLPEVPAPETLRIRDLLAHTSGLDNHTARVGYTRWAQGPHQPAEVLDYIFDETQGRADSATPAGSFSPSNADAYLLRVLVERVSGQPYPAFLRDTVFEPLGMADTGLVGTAYGPGDAPGYAFDEEERLNRVERWSHPSNLEGSADLVTTAADVVRWSNALHGSSWLSPASVNLMHRPVQANFGMGWAMGFVDDRPVATHPGGTDGFGSVIVRYIDDGTSIVVLTNTDVIDPRRISKAVGELLAGRKPAPPVEHPEVELNRRRAKRYRGHYVMSEQSREALAQVMTAQDLEHLRSVTVTLDEGRLFMSYLYWITKWLHPLGEDRFFIKDERGTLATFGPPGARKPQWLRLRSGHTEITFLRHEDPLEQDREVQRHRDRSKVERTLQEILVPTGE